MKIRYHFSTLPLLVLLGAAAAANAQVQPQLAKRYFEEATKLCERDAGRLWGVSLCGPMVIFDQATGTHATSQPEPEGPPPRFPGSAAGPVSWGGSTSPRRCPPCRSVSSRRRRIADVLRRKFRSRLRTRLRCAAGRSPAGMASTSSRRLGPWRLARLRNPQATDDGCCQGSGAL